MNGPWCGIFFLFLLALLFLPSRTPLLSSPPPSSLNLANTTAHPEHHHKDMKSPVGHNDATPMQYSEKHEAIEQAYEVSAELDPVAVGKLRRKIDIHLIPLISVLYLCSFLDRVNIGKFPI